MTTLTVDYVHPDIAVRFRWKALEEAEITLVWDTATGWPCLLMSVAASEVWIGSIAAPAGSKGLRERLEEADASGWPLPRHERRLGPDLHSSHQLSDALVRLGLVRAPLHGPEPLPCSDALLRKLWGQAVDGSTRAILNALGKCRGDRILSALGLISSHRAWRDAVEHYPALAPFLPFKLRHADTTSLDRLEPFEARSTPIDLEPAGVDLSAIVEAIPPPEPLERLELGDYLGLADLALTATQGDPVRARSLLPGSGGAAWTAIRWRIQLVTLNSCNRHLEHDGLREEIRVVHRMVEAFRQQLMLPYLFQERQPRPLTEAQGEAVRAACWDIVAGRAGIASALEWALDWRDIMDPPNAAALVRGIERLCDRYPMEPPPSWTPLLCDLDMAEARIVVLSTFEALSAEALAMRQTAIIKAIPLANGFCQVVKIIAKSVRGKGRTLSNALLVMAYERRPSVVWHHGPGGSKPPPEADEALNSYLHQLTNAPVARPETVGQHRKVEEASLERALLTWSYFMRRRATTLTQFARLTPVRTIEDTLNP